MTNTFIALLRGVNVGGATSFSTKDFVGLLEATGLRNIKTYIQSGNAVFQADTKDAAGLARKIRAGMQRKQAFAPDVIVLQLDEFERAVAGNPYRGADSNPKALHLMFLASIPKKAALAAFEKYRADDEEFSLKGRVLYFWGPAGIGRSKLFARIGKLPGIAGTARNWRTVGKLLELAREVAATDAKAGTQPNEKQNRNSK
jgi:uncharacterized protein (DUF1697 family)